MLSNLLDLVGMQSDFLSEARSRGVPRPLARCLQPAALQISPEDPGLVLQSRELLERAALIAAVGDCNNLEISFPRVDMLAQVFELLGLTRVSDIPDPFRRVWVSGGAEDRTRGVAMTCENGEIAVFCPVGAAQLAGGSSLELSYRGFSSSVSFPLKLIDSCLFPGGLMLHLTRPKGEGAIGRSEPRYAIQLDASVSRRHATDKLPCWVLDISLNGLRLDCSERFDTHEILALSLQLDSADEEPLHVAASVCWARETGGGKLQHGLIFEDLSDQQFFKLQSFLRLHQESVIVLVD